jgi:predicted TIM-barrel fold metal-dependent hydrolase
MVGVTAWSTLHMLRGAHTMVVDVHCHVWDYLTHFSEQFRTESQRAQYGMKVQLEVSYEQYRDNAPANSRAIVFGGKARRSGIWVPSGYVADFVVKHADRFIGFMSLDPTQEGWQDDMRYGHQDLRLRGIKLLPMYAGFYPHDRQFDPLWQYAEREGLPVLLHTGTTFVSQAPIDCTLPRHLDDVAIRFPELRLILAHLGHPYEGECVAVIRKHENVYADVSALYYRPFQLYQSLMLVQEYGVWHKVLFGTDYPFTTVNDTIAGLHALNDQVRGTCLPQLRSEEIEGVIHRDALRLLGLN